MIAIRRSTLTALTPAQRALVSIIPSHITLGDPAIFNDGTRDWYVYDDPRITIEDAVLVAVAVATPARLNALEGRDRAAVRQEIFDGHQWGVPDADAADPWDAALKANRGPNTVRAGHLPPNWTPVEVVS